MLWTSIQETTLQEKKRFTSTFPLQIPIIMDLPESSHILHSNFTLLYLVFAMKTTMVVALGLLSLFLVIQDGHAYQFKVGGSGDWSLASSASFDQWAHQSRFQIGDTILFNYESNKDSVVQVSETDYKNCSTASPIAKYSDGQTAIKLTQSGPHFFISGIVDHCNNNEKVMIIVMADRSKRSSDGPSSPPTAAPSPPPSAAAPSPPPASEEYPSPPPAPSTPETDLTPAPTPSDEHPPPPTPNSASLTVINFFCSVGAFGGFSVLFGF